MEDKQKIEMDIPARKGCLLYAYEMLKISSDPEHKAHKDLESLIEAMELSLETPGDTIELTSAQVACMVALGNVTKELDILGSLLKEDKVIEDAVAAAEGQDELTFTQIMEYATKLLKSAPASAKCDKRYNTIISLTEKVIAAQEADASSVELEKDEYTAYQALKAMHYAGIFKS